MTVEKAIREAFEAGLEAAADYVERIGDYASESRAAEIRCIEFPAALAQQPRPEQEAKEEARSDAWSDFESEFLTDGNGHAPVATYQACLAALISEWPNGRDRAIDAAKAAYERRHPATPAPAPSAEAVRLAAKDLLAAIDAHSGIRRGDMHHERRALKKALAALASPAPASETEG